MKKILGWLGAAALAASELPQVAPYKGLVVALAAFLLGGAHQSPAPSPK